MNWPKRFDICQQLIQTIPAPLKPVFPTEGGGVGVSKQPPGRHTLEFHFELPKALCTATPASVTTHKYPGILKSTENPRLLGTWALLSCPLKRVFFSFM